MKRGVLLAVLGACAAPVAAQSGTSSCPCLTSTEIYDLPGLSQYRTTGLSYTQPGSSIQVTFPVNYGVLCSAHDSGREPMCDGTGTLPGWCSARWCYVNKDSCSGAATVPSRYFRTSGLYFSYATCTGTAGGQGAPSSSNSFAQFSDEAVQGNKRLIALVEQYTRGSRNLLEKTILEANSSETCSIGSMCPCTGCSNSPDWGTSVNFNDVGLKVGPGFTSATTEEKRMAQCLGDNVGDTYLRVAAVEGDPDFSRVGYQYFADTATGSYTQWPNYQFCDADYDPRFREWFAAGATGPKDVIMLVDVSGSMSTRAGSRLRADVAKDAVKAVIQTLTFKDFANVILFNNGVSASFSSKMEPMTEATRNRMRDWCDSQIWNSGGTNFRTAFSKAFETMRNSVDAGTTSMCQKAIMFMTDGVDPEWTASDYVETRTKATENGAVILSYVLGQTEESKKTIPKTLACQNQGIFYDISDTDAEQLGPIMADYYSYFAAGVEMCAASFVKYTDAVTDRELYAGCMATYDRSGVAPKLSGVTCMDISMFESIENMRAEADGWAHFKCQATDRTKQCRATYLQECDLEKLREASPWSQKCDASYDTSVQCQCVSPNCQDDAEFVDSKGYYCDTWVGDDCNAAGQRFGYTASEIQTILVKCKRSCGQCQYSSSCNPQVIPEECSTISVSDTCKACTTSTQSGVDIDGNVRSCPTGDGPGGSPGMNPDATSSAARALAGGWLVALSAAFASQ